MAIFISNQSSSGSGTITSWVQEPAVITQTTANPTFGTVATSIIRSRKVGDSVDLVLEHVQSAPGTAGVGVVLIALPVAYTIDTSKISLDTTSEGPVVGVGQYIDTGYEYCFNVIPYDSTHLALWLVARTLLNSNSFFVAAKQVDGTVFNFTDVLTFSFSVQSLPVL